MHLQENNGKSTETSQEKELSSRFQAQEEELMQLRKQLADASIKELELLKEKHVLEKRFAGMRLDLDQQQNELITAASQALSDRKTKIEENMRLAQTLLETEQERSIFLSSLLRLLADYDLQPVVVNASTIVRNIQVLLQNLRGKLKTALADRDPLNSQTMNHAEKLSEKVDIQQSAPLSNNNPHFPVASSSSFYQHQLYPHAYAPVSTAPNIPNYIPMMDGKGGGMLQSSGPSGMQHVTINGNLMTTSSRIKVTERLANATSSEGRTGGTDNYSDHFSFNRVQNLAVEQSHVKGVLDARSNLPNVNDEPIFSVPEEHLVPGIEDFQIYGDARLGCVIQACGRVNGATVCMFQWVYIEDDQYIDVEEATYPEYLVTADDVDKVIAVHCIPVSGSGQQGSMVMAVANNQQRIPLDQDVVQEIETYLSMGEAVFNVLLSLRQQREYSEVWEHANLVLDRSGFKIQFNNSEYVIDKGYSYESTIEIPFADRRLCILKISNGESYLLNTNGDLRLRDILVLTMREFQHQALFRREI